MKLLHRCVAVSGLTFLVAFDLHAQNDDALRKHVLAELKKIGGTATIDPKAATTHP